MENMEVVPRSKYIRGGLKCIRFWKAIVGVETRCDTRDQVVSIERDNVCVHVHVMFTKFVLLLCIKAMFVNFGVPFG